MKNNYRPDDADFLNFGSGQRTIRERGRTKRDKLSGKKARYERRKAEKAAAQSR